MLLQVLVDLTATAAKSCAQYESDRRAPSEMLRPTKEACRRHHEKYETIEREHVCPDCGTAADGRLPGKHFRKEAANMLVQMSWSKTMYNNLFGVMTRRHRKSHRWPQAFEFLASAHVTCNGLQDQGAANVLRKS